MQPGMIVEKHGKRGVVMGSNGYIVPDCPGNILVMWEGINYLLEENPENEDLKVVGMENSAVDLRRCGAGKGHETCIFLAVGPNGRSV